MCTARHGRTTRQRRLMDEPIQIVIHSFTVSGFFNPMQYIKMKKLAVKQFELLPVTPVFVHPKNTAELPGYYSDIIMHTDVKYVQRNITVIVKYDPVYVFYGFTVIDFLLACMSVCFFYRSRRKTVKSFLDLRGCNWGYTGDNSLSSSLAIRKLLRSYGENSSFFGNIISKLFFTVSWRATFSDPNLFVLMTPFPNHNSMYSNTFLFVVNICVGPY